MIAAKVETAGAEKDVFGVTGTCLQDGCNPYGTVTLCEAAKQQGQLNHNHQGQAHGTLLEQHGHKLIKHDH